MQVVDETTLKAAGALVAAGHRPLALNFANGVSPGGGFLNGLRRRSADRVPSSRRSTPTPCMRRTGNARGPIRRTGPFSRPALPVFRTDRGHALVRPWRLCFITAAAPVATRIGQPEAAALLKQRIHRVLAVSRAHGYRTLVLGAWGCGAFGNDPHQTAEDFRAALADEYVGAFRQVLFAISDWSPERRFLGPFRDVMQRR